MSRHALPLEVWIAGRARTKGSLTVRGHRANGSAIFAEQVTGSKEWRSRVAETVLRACGAVPGPRGPVVPWEPYTGPVVVSCVVHLQRPASGVGATSAWPDRLRDGDLDKYQRNIGDALTDTRVIADDGQIVGWVALKCWANPVDGPGALVRVGIV